IAAVAPACVRDAAEQPALTSEQLAALKPPARPVAGKATEPAGVDDAAPLVSATVAVHVDGWLTAPVAGLHTMVVEGVLRLTVIAAVPTLPLWVPSRV